MYFPRWNVAICSLSYNMTFYFTTCTLPYVLSKQIGKGDTAKKEGDSTDLVIWSVYFPALWMKPGAKYDMWSTGVEITCVDRFLKWWVISGVDVAATTTRVLCSNIYSCKKRIKRLILLWTLLLWLCWGNKEKDIFWGKATIFFGHGGWKGGLYTILDQRPFASVQSKIIPMYHCCLNWKVWHNLMQVFFT